MTERLITARRQLFQIPRGLLKPSFLSRILIYVLGPSGNLCSETKAVTDETVFGHVSMGSTGKKRLSTIWKSIGSFQATEK